MHVASWVVMEEKKNLYRSLVRFLRDGRESLLKVERWWLEVRGKKPICMSRLNEMAILIQVSSEEAVSRILEVVRNKISESHFCAPERWMEF